MKASQLTFVFENPRALHHFWVWLCESGEQQYWEWMREREGDEDGDITGLSFDYGKADAGKVVVKCGRFTGAADTEAFDDNDGRNTDWSEDV